MLAWGLFGVSLPGTAHLAVCSLVFSGEPTPDFLFLLLLPFLPRVVQVFLYNVVIAPVASLRA